MSSLYHRFARVPVVGWVLRWFVAVVKLPSDRIAASHRQAILNERLESIDEQIRKLANSAQQLVDLGLEPTVLKTLGESVPISLRALRRDVESLRSQIEELES